METEDRREIEESHRAIKKQNLYQEQKKYLNTFTSQISLASQTHWQMKSIRKKYPKIIITNIINIILY